MKIVNGHGIVSIPTLVLQVCPVLAPCACSPSLTSSPWLCGPDYAVFNTSFAKRDLSRKTFLGKPSPRVFCCFESQDLTSFLLTTTKICQRTTARRGRVSNLLLLLTFLLICVAGPKGSLPAYKFPSAADLAAAEGTAKELQELASLQEGLVRTVLSHRWSMQ